MRSPDVIRLVPSCSAKSPAKETHLGVMGTPVECLLRFRSSGDPDRSCYEWSRRVDAVQVPDVRYQVVQRVVDVARPVTVRLSVEPNGDLFEVPKGDVVRGSAVQQRCQWVNPVT
ncbi:hypothetical protein TIFTF001_039135 [Ficus carica]|uniref:Uncharacterized protein n=1 Tax=Ficus carica TaxID=3494 RepID=A0AA88E8J9_FICCA|nr:hypothetical protein TIFTF001_039125 [Ficus carica]GMN70089.1 hypothetical protein TIFTF001_039135 [Ficus carica]